MISAGQKLRRQRASNSVAVSSSCDRKPSASSGHIGIPSLILKLDQGVAAWTSFWSGNSETFGNFRHSDSTCISVNTDLNRQSEQTCASVV